jgi:hypothetical protein
MEGNICLPPIAQWMTQEEAQILESAFERIVETASKKA